MSFFSINQRCVIIIPVYCINVYIDWNISSGERCGPWAFCSGIQKLNDYLFFSYLFGKFLLIFVFKKDSIG